MRHDGLTTLETGWQPTGLEVEWPSLAPAADGVLLVDADTTSVFRRCE